MSKNKEESGETWPFKARPGDVSPMHPDLEAEIHAVVEGLRRLNNPVADKYANMLFRIEQRWRMVEGVATEEDDD